MPTWLQRRWSGYPRRALVDCLAADRADPIAALRAYEARWLGLTAAVVRINRTAPPDAIIREVCQRAGDRPLARIEDVIPPAELTAMLESHGSGVGYAQVP